jgi:cysteine desulfurase
MLSLDAIYLDYNASAPFPGFLREKVADILFQCQGNPSSLHAAGRRSRRFINDATEEVAAYLGCHHHQVFWTSGASESNSWVVHSALLRAHRQHPERKPRIIISAIEHESLALAAESAAIGPFQADVVVIPVNSQGVVNIDALAQALTSPADLVSIMYANNETGVIQPVDQIAALCQQAAVPYHCDAVQALGKQPLNLSKLGVSYASFSAHKIGGPKGIGFLIVTGKGRLLDPLIHGKQQKELRGGTEAPFAIATTGLIIKALRKKQYSLDTGTMRDQFEAKLKELIPGTIIHGEGAARLNNTSYVGFTGVDGDGLLMNLDMEGVYASSGSACSSGSTDPSSVLIAMGVDARLARSSVRFSSGPETTWQHYERVLTILPELVQNARRIQGRVRAEAPTVLPNVLEDITP